MTDGHPADRLGGAGARSAPWLCAGVPWRQLAADAWERVLSQVVQMGLDVVDVDTGWGEPDGPGEGLAGFVDRCADKGLSVVVAPGALAPAGGAPALAACAGDRRWRELERSLRPLLEPLAARTHPAGPVVALQLADPAAPWLGGACGGDLGPDPQRRYRRWLEGRYRTVGALNDAYGSAYPGFGAVDPPGRSPVRSRAELVARLDWARFAEHRATVAGSRLRALARACGLEGVPVLRHRPLSRASGREDLGDEAAAALTGLTVGSPVWARPALIDEELFTVASAFARGVRSATYRWVVEAGHWVAGPVTADGRRRVERLSPYRQWHRLLDELGWSELTPARDALLLRSIDVVRLGSALALADPAVLPAGAAAGPDPEDVPEACDGDGLAPEALLPERVPDLAAGLLLAERRWSRAVGGALRQIQAGFATGDTRLSLSRLLAYPLVILPCVGVLAEDAQQRLLDYVVQGGTLLLGPLAPERDGDLRPCDLLGGHLARAGTVLSDAQVRNVHVPAAVTFDEVDDDEVLLRAAGGPVAYRRALGGGELLHLGVHLPSGAHAETAALLRPLLTRGGVSPRVRGTNPAVELEVLASSRRTVVCARNATDREQRTVVTAPDRLRLRWWAGAPASGDPRHGSATVDMPARTVAVWELA